MLLKVKVVFAFFSLLLLSSIDAVLEHIELSRGIRLRDGHRENIGRVEVLHAGQWGTVCSNGWTHVDAYVACRQLGFLGVLNWYVVSSGYGPVWLSGVECKGQESELSKCRHEPWGRNRCGNHGNDVGLVCRETESNEEETCRGYPDTPILAIRVVGKSPHKGLVQMRVEGSWQPICADQWGSKDAKVACGQLGYPGGTAKVVARKSTARLRGVSTNFSCDGSESVLQVCRHSGFGSYRCQKPAYASVKCTLRKQSKRNVAVRLRGSAYPWQGRVEVYDKGQWKKVCDHEWGILDASVVCRELGYGTAYEAVYRARDYFGQGFSPILLNEVGCTGLERSLLQCPFSGAECFHIENAGVRCHHPAATTSNTENVRLISGAKGYGRLEVLHENSQQWGTVCGDSFDIESGTVICRQLNLGFAGDVRYSSRYQYSSKDIQLVNLTCDGKELTLTACKNGEWEYASQSACKKGPVYVTCTCRLPDLIPHFATIQQSLTGVTHSPLNLVRVSSLKCAYEENCLSSSADKYFHSGEDNNELARNENRRTLLRFSVNIFNFGTADFKPFLPRGDWEWHTCHNHYHSFENFAQYDILDLQGREVAEGHKASFCLEDVQCASGGAKRYSCQHHLQGISVNCYDSYAYDIDCQWIDLTDVAHGNYTLVVSLNSEHKRAEMDYTNNNVMCDFEYRSDPVFYLTGKLDNIHCRLSG